MNDEFPTVPPVALLLIDLQPAFLEAVPHGAKAARRAQLALEAARLLGLSVAFTEQVPEKMGGTLPSLREKGGDAPAFAKTAFSALGADGLVDWLRARKIEHLLLAGIETPICVYQSVVQAMAEGFDVTLLSDAIAERRHDDRGPALHALRAAGAHVLPTETVFYSLVGDARHPRFREFTQLIKSA